MNRVRRTRQPEVGRVRRTRNRVQDVTHRFLDIQPSAMSHTLLVSCVDAPEGLSDEQFKEWISQAIWDYHTRRHGYVGFSAAIQIKPPVVKVA